MLAVALEKMALRDMEWPDFDSIKEITLINSFTEGLPANQVYVVCKFEQKCIQSRMVGIVELYNQPVWQGTRRFWCPDKLCQEIDRRELPFLLAYGGLKSIRGGKQMHDVTCMNITPKFEWIRSWWSEQYKVSILGYSVGEGGLQIIHL